MEPRTPGLQDVQMHNKSHPLGTMIFVLFLQPIQLLGLGWTTNIGRTHPLGTNGRLNTFSWLPIQYIYTTEVSEHQKIS